MKHISFVRIVDEDLTKRTTGAIIAGFDLTTSNADLYFGALMASSSTWLPNVEKCSVTIWNLSGSPFKSK